MYSSVEDAQSMRGTMDHRARRTGDGGSSFKQHYLKNSPNNQIFDKTGEDHRDNVKNRSSIQPNQNLQHIADLRKTA